MLQSSLKITNPLNHGASAEESGSSSGGELTLQVPLLQRLTDLLMTVFGTVLFWGSILAVAAVVLVPLLGPLGAVVFLVLLAWWSDGRRSGL